MQGGDVDQFVQELAACANLHDLEQLRVAYLGKKGKVAAQMLSLRTAAPDQRPQLGQRINQFKEYVEQQLAAAVTKLEADEWQQRLEGERLDVTLPGTPHRVGRPHLVLQVMDEALAILRSMGFAVSLAPNVESEYYNFEALNFAPHHPARDMQDTFYIRPDVVLRTHTTNMQVRAMETQELPIRVVSPGTCFRNEDVSRRSHVAFHQIDGLYINTAVSFVDLFHTLQILFTRLFSSPIDIRFRPSYFPFVEPGVEVDIACLMCEGKGCAVCKRSGWLEVAGAGMVHPEVLKNGGIDPEAYQGYAWGFGIERIVMLRYGVPDIRLFMENRLQFLTQF